MKNSEPTKNVAAVTTPLTLLKYAGNEPRAKHVDPMAKSHAIVTVKRWPIGSVVAEGGLGRLLGWMFPQEVNRVSDVLDQVVGEVPCEALCTTMRRTAMSVALSGIV